MTYRDRPEYTAPSDIRCDALVAGKKGWPDWAQKDHRCPRRATQSRCGKSVCWQHAEIDNIRFVEEALGRNER
jgi:hypothetical protein